MKKILIFILILVNITILFGIKIVSFSGEILNGEFLSMTNTQLFFKVNGKVSKLPIQEIKNVEFSPEEKSNMFFSLVNNYTFKGILKKIENDYFVFKNSEKTYRISKKDLKIIISKKRVESKILATNFGRFHFSPLEIISDKFWKVNTDYGILILPSESIQSSFRPNISSENKNILYLTNGDYFFYDSISIKNSLFNFYIYNFSIQIQKSNILFLKDHSFSPLKIKSKKLFRLNVNDKNYFLDNYEIKDNKIILENEIIKNPNIKFISNSIINLFILPDVFYSGISTYNEKLYVSGYSKNLYELSYSGKILNKYNISSYSFDFPVIYNDNIYISNFRKNLTIVDLKSKKIKEVDISDPYSGVTILNENRYLIHLWSKYLYLIEKENIISSINTTTSKRSPLIDYEGNIIDLDINGNLKKIDKNFNIIFELSLNGKTDFYNIDIDNNIYINGPDKTFTVLDKNGKMLFSYKMENIPYSFPLIDNKTHTIYVTSKDLYLYALKDGKILWKSKVGYFSGTGVLTDKYVIINNLTHEILFINRNNGKIEKIFNLGYSHNLSMDKNGFLYCASSNGVIAIIDVNDNPINQYKFNIQHTGNPNIK
ncbi:hypothetical protein [Marinitoga aeolica]|uniref:Uncharacterized protein n=1 Tax=Marinitoga aeolica TaxID=2809031 RepID=A0ABY8PPC9_9BACT|nr:hypothetical protein [Marinitoga aeolica]WGS64490.1 hypothetical protein JRV97_08930 [Marinitoga aeolica]